jgi:hypothetical protein
MIKVKCPKCELWFVSQVRSGEMICTACNNVFTVGRGK